VTSIPDAYRLRGERETAARYELALQAINEGVYDWNVADGTIHYSDRLYQVLDMTPEILRTPAHWRGRIHPDDLPRYDATHVAHFKGETERFECDYRYRARNGAWRWARQHGIALRDEHGRVCRMIGSTGDITELKDRERELAQKTAILETTLENIDQGITMVDGELRTIALNRRFLELLDMPAERFARGFHMEDAFRFNAERGEYGPGDVEAQVQGRLEVARRFEAHAFERVRPNGTVLCIRGRPLPGGGFVSTYTDITEQRRSEQALRDSEARYALATSAATEGIYEWNVDDGSLFLSDRAKSFFAFPSEPLTPQAWNTRVHPDDFEGYRRALRAHFQKRTSHLEHEYRICRADGSDLWVLDRGIAVRNAGGRVARLIGALSDITQRKRAELELRRARDEAQEALEQQTATAEILKVISSSPTDIEPVFRSILANAVRLCEASVGAVFTYDGEVLANVAHQNASPEFAEFLARSRPRPSRETTTRRCALERRTVHTADLLNDPEYAPLEFQRREHVRTVLSVPMMRDDRLVGVVTLWRREVRAFSDQQIALVQTFADQAVIAIENVRLFNETKEALDSQKATGEILASISGSITDTRPVFDAIARNLLRVFGTRFAVVELLRDGQIEVVAMHGDPGFERLAQRYPTPLDDGTIGGAAMLSGEIVQCTPVIGNPGIPADIQQLARDFGFDSCIGAPMIREDKVVGAICTAHRTAVPFSDKQRALLRTFADQAVIAIENARLFNETREALEQQKAVRGVLETLSRSAFDLDAVLHTLIESTTRLSHAEKGFIFRREGDVFRFAVDFGASEEFRDFIERNPVGIDSGTLVGRTALEGRTVHIEDAVADARFTAKAAQELGRFRTMLGVPIIRDRTVIGVIALWKERVEPFTDAQIALVTSFSSQASIAIENARLFNETKEALDFQKATSEILASISGSITEAKPVFDSIACDVLRLFGTRFASVQLLRDGQIEVIAAHGEPGFERIEQHYPRPLDGGTIGGSVIVSGNVVQFTPVIGNPHIPATTEQMAHDFGFDSVIGAPMIRDHEVVGAIVTAHRSAIPFSDKQVALLRTFADQAVIAIENARLFNETKEALEQQSALAEVLGAISGSIADTKPVFDKILDSCQRLFEGHLVGLTLAGEDGLVHLGAYKGENKEQMERVYPYPLDRDSGSGQAMLDRTVVQFADVGAPGSNAPLQVVKGAQAVGFRSIVFAPLIAEGRAIGALWVGRRLPGPFDDKQTALLKTFADQAVIAVQNARLFSEIQDKSQQLEIANRHKSEFLANVSHELRTPLNAIIGFTRIVMRRSKEQLEPKQYENLEKILLSGQNLLALINAILDLSKVEAGRVELNPVEIELAPVLEQCLRTIEPLIDDGAVTLIREFDARLPRIVVDEEKLRQIVINLLSNAAKFTSSGSIRVRAIAVNGSVDIAVADTGIGIAADKLALIFEAFEQGDAGNTRDYGGTGLGLTIARRLARLMGGDIRVESALGRGSIFTLTLPGRDQALQA
jgi:PAS domain S-box-containing protein